MTEKLKQATAGYWDLSDNIDSRLEYYISKPLPELDNQSLLQAELAYAKENNNLPVTTCQTLVMLVGFSLEPLLQSVCAYQPQKVILLLNKKGYGQEKPEEFLGHITEAIGHLKCKKQEVSYLCVADTPAGVFQKLNSLSGEKNVIIDITGGKKSMVSGAFMYAAYSNIPISYVDFDNYDHKTRRPYGYSCKIGELKNPYQLFALREWERVRSLYENYQFREAQKMVESLQETMTGVFSEAQTPIKKLISFLQYYEAWDSGDYKKAKDLANSLGDFNRPDAVTALGDNWPNRTHFYADSNLHIYLFDELARIQRLIEKNEDYRSAFLRAGGLNEIVMLARLVSAVTNPSEKNALLNAMENDTPGIYKIFENLLSPIGSCLQIGKDKNGRVKFGNQQNLLATIKIQKTMETWWTKTSQFSSPTDGWKCFLEKRNKLAHTYFSVGHDESSEALAFVTANIKDFYEQSVAALNVHTSAMTWGELCTITGLVSFLPPNLR